MSRTAALVGAIILVASPGLWWSRKHGRDRAEIFEPPSRVTEAAPLCPWRDPDADTQRIFPNSNRRESVVRILSGLRTEMAARLGRQLTAEENALTVNRIYCDSELLGEFVVRRVKGE